MEWTTITGYENYLVSNTGLIKNKLSGKILKPYDNGNGYKKVTLCYNGKKSKKYIHRLVAYEYCEGYQEGYTVNHIDMNTENNSAHNLEWMPLELNVQLMHKAYSHKINN